MKTITTISLFLALVLLVGCGGAPVTVTPPPTATEAPQATHTRVKPSPTARATATKTAATETPLVEDIVAPDESTEVMAAAKTALNLRAGPGTEYPVVGGLAQEAEIQVVGRLADGSWLQVETDQGQPAWMTGLDKYITVDEQLLAKAPVVEAPPPPVATVTPTVPADTGDQEEPSDQTEATDQPPPETQPVTDTPTVESQPVISRPPTGVIQPNVTNLGCGQFEVENGTAADGVVALMLGEQAVTAAYVRAGETATMFDIGDGVYQIYFTTGSDWDGNQFTQGASYQRFEDTLPYETTATTCNIWNVTLHGVVGGNAATEGLPADQFPRLGQ